MKSIYQLGLFVLLVVSTPWLQAEQFPKPASLKDDIDFWLRVYTEINTQSGFIHDASNLAVVYETINVKGSANANQRYIRQTKKKYSAILESLATGKRVNLTDDEKHVLLLWGKDVSDQRLKIAARELRFQRGQSDRFRQGLVRSGEWREYIDNTFREMALPAELSVLPHVESSFNPSAYSRVGATGLWQFIRSTGKRYMRIDHLIDERRDPFVSTVAAGKLLRHNYQLTQSWPLALTAYNHGVASMRRAITSLGTRDIATIVRHYKGRNFGFASRNFYVAFLAALEIDTHPEKYFGPITYTSPVNYEMVKLDSYYFTKDLAKYLNVSKRQLKQHNRALLDSVWSGNKRIPKGFTLRIPRSLLTQSVPRLLAEMPASLRYDTQTPDHYHFVERGDTISEIAGIYGYRIKDILVANGLQTGHYIRAGQKLRLPLQSRPDQQLSPPGQPEIIVADARHEKSINVVTSPETDKAGVQTEVHRQLTKGPAQNNSHYHPQETAEVVNKSVDDENSLVSTVAEPELGDTNTPALLSDPADYTVDSTNKIVVQASETLGHYAEWLDIRASRLRGINNMSFGEPVILGKQITLDFSNVSPRVFESRRVAYQKQLQETFFTRYRIEKTEQHLVKKGESVWILALHKFKVPIWLLRQHNPDLDFHRIRPGASITVPSLLEVKDE